jgi:predicted porin
MKKSLFAIAAVTAFAGAAQAQSSVSVYGIMDVGFQGVTTRGPLTTTNATPVNQNFTRFSGEGAQTTSRLGFRGTEDLGGGMSAFFTAEFGLNPTDNNLSGNANSGLFNRQAFVGIAQKGVGRAAIGTQYTPIHSAVGRTDPGQQNNMVGSVIYTTNASQGQGQTAQSYTVRYNNALTLQTERMAGFTLNAIYSNNNGKGDDTSTALPFNGANTQVVNAGGTYTTSVANVTSTGLGQSNNTAWGIGANYVWKKLNVDAAYQTSKQTMFLNGVQQTAALPATTSVGRIPANVLGTSLGMTQVYAGAVYDFGILKAYAGYINAKYESNVNSNSYVTRSGQQIGVRGNWTPKIESWASVGNGIITAGSGINIPNTAGVQQSQNFTAYQLGTNYILSKRTNLYAIFGSTQVSGSSVNMSEGASSYGIGARHTF